MTPQCKEAPLTTKRIACLGPSTGVPGEPLYEFMTTVGRYLALAGHEVLTGGFGGAGMEAPARGAREVEGTVTGYTMLGRPGNEFLANSIPCEELELTRQHTPRKHSDLVEARYWGIDGRVKPKSPELQYGIRLGFLLMADGFIIAGGGGPGTLTELLAIMNLGAKVWERPKRVALVPGWGGDGATPWDKAMLDALATWVPIPDRVRAQIRVVTMPEAAVAWATGGN